MSTTTFYFLGFFMVLTIVNCRKFTAPVLPRQVDFLELQCRARGYPGACEDVNFHQGELECDDLACAKPIGNNQFKVAYVGRVADGTKCHRRKVCLGGVCEKVPIRNMPRQMGGGAYFKCIADSNSEGKK